MKMQWTGVSLLVGALVGGAMVARAADAVEPVSVTFTNVRGEAASSLPGVGVIYRGSTLLFTNCVMYQGTNSASDVQGLDGVTVELTVGN